MPSKPKSCYDFDKTSHAVFTLNYHLIICVKYRRKVFTEELIINELKERTRKIADQFDIQIIDQECDVDHTHILFKAKPNSDLVKFVNSLKCVTSRVIQNKFPEVKQELWNKMFWSKSYCLITTGQVTLDQLKKYVENQGKNHAKNI